MGDRSSRPHRSPTRTRHRWCARSCLRWKQRLGPVAIADQVGVAASTVHAVLVRCRLNRLSHVHRVSGEPVCRYQHPYPGALRHVDVNKLGNVPDGGGWGYVGRKQGSRNRAATPDKPRNPWHNPSSGPRWCTPSSMTGTDESSRRAAEFVKENLTGSADPPVITEGGTVVQF